MPLYNTLKSGTQDLQNFAVMQSGSRFFESKQNERSLGDHLQLGMTPSQLGKFETNQDYIGMSWKTPHHALKREDRLGKEPFAGFGTVVEDITESGYTKNQPILLGFF